MQAYLSIVASLPDGGSGLTPLRCGQLAAPATAPNKVKGQVEDTPPDRGICSPRQLLYLGVPVAWHMWWLAGLFRWLAGGLGHIAWRPGLAFTCTWKGCVTRCPLVPPVAPCDLPRLQPNCSPSAALFPSAPPTQRVSAQWAPKRGTATTRDEMYPQQRDGLREATFCTSKQLK